MSYKVQIDDVVRDATPEEVVQLQAQHAAAAAQQAASDAEAAAAESARAKLAALGLSEAEIKALVG